MNKKYKFLKDFGNSKKDDILELPEEDGKKLVELGYCEEVENVDNENPFVKQVQEAIVEFKKQLAEVIVDATKGITKSKSIPIQVIGDVAEEDANGGFDNFGDFCKDVVLACDPRGSVVPEKLEKHESYWAGRKIKGVTDPKSGIKVPSGGMAEELGESAGWLVPAEMSNKIFEKMWEEFPLINMIDMYTVKGNSWEANGVLEDARTAGNRFGGVTTAWIGEGKQITPSRAKFHRIKLKLEKLAALVNVTNEQLEDSSISLAQFLTKVVGKAMGYDIAESFLSGDGVAKPQGIQNAACLVGVAKEKSGYIKAEDVLNMWKRVPARLRANAVWHINQANEDQLDKMYMSVWNVAEGERVGGWPVYMPPGEGIRQAPTGILKGRPVIPLEFCEVTLSGANTLVLAVWDQYIGILKGGARGGIQTAISIHLRFDYDEQVFRFTYRIDGQPWWGKAVTPAKGSNTLSPFIRLNAD